MGKIITEEQREKSRERNRRYALAHPNANKDYYHAHKEQMNAAVKIWREKNSEKLRAQRLKLKLSVFAKLGNKCVVCDETDHRVLQIDHIAGDGAKDRAESKNQRWSFYKRILTDDAAHVRYQLLCANDNWRKRWDNNEAG